MGFRGRGSTGSVLRRCFAGPFERGAPKIEGAGAASRQGEATSIRALGPPRPREPSLNVAGVASLCPACISIPVDIRDLEDFLAVLAHGSILGAAEESGVAQPALIRRMRALEKSLGVPLLTRSPRGVTPTVYGELLERHARLVLRDRQQAVDELRALRDGVVGHARVGVAPTLSGLLPVAIEHLCQEHPGLTFSIVEGTYGSLVRDLRSGEIDGLFSLLAPGAAHEGLIVRPLADDPLQILCNPKHPPRRKKRLRLADLADARWAFMSEPRSLVEAFLDIAASHGLESPRITVRTDSLDILKSLVLRGSLLTVLPRGAVRSELMEKRASVLRTVERLPEPAAAFLHRQEVLPPAVALLADEVSSIGAV